MLRQQLNTKTFGLSYGAYPPKVSATLKIPLAEAESIFNNYHNVLYPGITDYRENYVLPTASANGKLHLGLGCYISTNDANKDIRTLANNTCQFWSIITALTINRIHQLADATNFTSLQCVSTIYDSIYYILPDTPEHIKWLNDNIVPVITTDFMENQTIHNAAAGEIGYDWATLKGIPNNASISDITAVRDSLRAPHVT